MEYHLLYVDGRFWNLVHQKLRYRMGYHSSEKVHPMHFVVLTLDIVSLC